jgi:hypothetical protein
MTTQYALMFASSASTKEDAPCRLRFA